MTRDLISRPDWSPAYAGDTIAGGHLRGAGDWSSPVARAVPDNLPAALKDRWSEREAGGLGYRLAIAQDTAGAVLGRLSEENRADLVAAIDSLPEGVRGAIFEELGQGTSGHVRGASDSEVNDFAASAIGNDLVREWGSRAARNVAVFHRRASRMLDGMTDEGVGYFMARFTTLNAEQTKAIIRELAK